MHGVEENLLLLYFSLFSELYCKTHEQLFWPSSILASSEPKLIFLSVQLKSKQSMFVLLGIKLLHKYSSDL